MPARNLVKLIPRKFDFGWASAPDPAGGAYSVPPDPSHTHTRLTALFPGLPGRAGTRNVKPIWILLKLDLKGPTCKGREGRTIPALFSLHFVCPQCSHTIKH